jgi:hypothetical protein
MGVCVCARALMQNTHTQTHTQGAMKLSITNLSMTAFSIMKLSIVIFSVRINKT